jgi:integrase/recombinase XerD
MQEAAQQGYITHESAEQFKHVKGLKISANKERKSAHVRTPISKAQMQAFINAPEVNTLAGKMHHALLLTLATAGMRISEAVALKVNDIQWDEDEDGHQGWLVYVLGKNMDKPEPRALGKRAKQAIDQWLVARPIDSEYVFTGFAGRGDSRATDKPITRMAAWQLVQHYAEAVGLEHIKPHDLRRYVGTQLAKRDIRLAQKQLGHKRIETTAQNYVLDSIRLGVTDDLI